MGRRGLGSVGIQLQVGVGGLEYDRAMVEVKVLADSSE
jgi:hypothetical protein